MFQEDSALDLESTPDPDGYVVRIAGELDWFGCLALEIALIEAEQSEAHRILLDLDELTFVEARGLTMIVKAAYNSAMNGGRLRITKGRGQVATMFRVMGLDTTLPFTTGPVPGPSSSRPT